MEARAAARWFLRGLLVVIFGSYLLDTAQFYSRSLISGKAAATSAIHRTRLLAIPHKGGKTEYQVDSVQPEEDLPCSKSLFPHSGMSPCWYVRKHASDPIPM